MSGRVVIQPSTKHTATIIFLHGLGDTGHGWADAMTSVRPTYSKVICPTAETMRVTLNAGFRMPSWFDLLSLDDNQPEDEKGIRAARDSIHALIDECTSGDSAVPVNRVLLGGFSQGGALALYSALTYPRGQLAGVMALSCWLPLRNEFPAACLEQNKSIPILQCHGDCDPLVPYKWGQMTTQVIRKFAPQLEFKTYRGMTHSSCEQEIDDMKQFVSRLLPAQ